jgi:hypothetical protein
MKQDNRDKYVAYSLAFLFCLAWLSNVFVAQAEPKPDKLAQACRPAEGERSVVEWNVDEYGNKALVVSKQKAIGTRKGAIQYAILSVEEMQ